MVVVFCCRRCGGRNIFLSLILTQNIFTSFSVVQSSVVALHSLARTISSKMKSYLILVVHGLDPPRSKFGTVIVQFWSSCIYLLKPQQSLKSLASDTYCERCNLRSSRTTHNESFTSPFPNLMLDSYQFKDIMDVLFAIIVVLAHLGIWVSVCNVLRSPKSSHDQSLYSLASRITLTARIV